MGTQEPKYVFAVKYRVNIKPINFGMNLIDFIQVVVVNFQKLRLAAGQQQSQD